MEDVGQQPGGRASLSVCVITRDAEAVLGRCLASVAGLASQVVVLDSGSGDRTRELAAAAGAEVWEQPFLGYVAQKQLAFERATGDWVLGLDADEWLDEEARKEVARVLARPLSAGVAGYALRRRNFYLGRFLEHGWSREWKLRLVRRGCGRWVGGEVHERLQVEGTTGRLRGALLHFPFPDLSSHLQRVDLYTGLVVRAPLAVGRARILAGMLVEPWWVLLRELVLRGGLADGLRGVIAATMTAFDFFVRYAKLWEAAPGAGRRASPPAEKRPG